MRKFYCILALFFVFSGSLPALADTAPSSAPAQFKQDKLVIQTAGNKTLNFTVEVADTKPLREEGLQHRSTLAEDHGMLFVFEDDSYVEMWMKDTLISLDMLFLDDQGKIVYIAAKTQPESTDTISAKREAKAVLELAGGVTEKLGIKTGDQVVYSTFKP